MDAAIAVASVLQRSPLPLQAVDTDSDFLTTLVAPGLGLLPQAPVLCLLADGSGAPLSLGLFRPREDSPLLAGTE